MKLTLVWLTVNVFSLCGVAQPLPTSTPGAEGLDAQRLDRTHALVQEYVTSGRHAGAVSLVARHGKIIDCRAYGYRDLEAKLPMEPDTIMRIYSMTKVITGVAVLQLFEQGRFRLSDPITNWMPELANPTVCIGGTPDNPKLEPARTPITIKMLMNHTAGFTYDDDYFSKLLAEIYRRANLWDSSSLDEFVGKLAKLPLISQPGAEFNYGVGFDVLGLLVERVSGERFDAYCEKHIFEPLGMKDTGFDVPPEKMARLAKTYTREPDGKLREAEVSYGRTKGVRYLFSKYSRNSLSEQSLPTPSFFAALFPHPCVAAAVRETSLVPAGGGAWFVAGGSSLVAGPSSLGARGPGRATHASPLQTACPGSSPIHPSQCPLCLCGESAGVSFLGR